MPGGYVVRDANGQALAYLYSRDTEVEAMQAKVLTKDEARRIAVNINYWGRPRPGKHWPEATCLVATRTAPDLRSRAAPGIPSS
jgi:hypothetical protein